VSTHQNKRKLSRKELIIQKDIIRYFARVKEATPSYYYIKQRNRGVCNYVFNQHSGKYGPFGDLRRYFRNMNNFKNEQLKCIKEINKNLPLILIQDRIRKMMEKEKK
jgi:hypothetical protein